MAKRKSVDSLFDFLPFAGGPPPMPELPPKLRPLADEIIQQGPLGLAALLAYLFEHTANDPEWNRLLADAPQLAELTGRELLHGPAVPDDGLIYKVKITLRGLRPAIFREVEVPNMTLGDLHLVIQVAMGWEMAHLHAFRIQGEDYGELEFNDPFCPRRDEESVSLAQLVAADQRRFTYEYDFGDSWEHDILISAPKPPKPGVLYPRCIKGDLACPPEDCGGIYGYLQLCELLSTPKTELNDDDLERLDWLGDYDPQAFSVAAVTARLQAMYQPPEPPAGKKKSRAKKK